MKKKNVCQTAVLQVLYLSGLISQNIPNHSELVLNIILKTFGVGTCDQVSWFHPILWRLSTQEVLRVTPAYKAFENVCASFFVRVPVPASIIRVSKVTGLAAFGLILGMAVAG